MTKNEHTPANKCKLIHVKNKKLNYLNTLDYDKGNFYDLKFNADEDNHFYIDKWKRPHFFSPILNLSIVLENIETGELFLLTSREKAKYYRGCHLTRKKYAKLNELYETDEDKFWETVDFMTNDD